MKKIKSLSLVLFVILSNAVLLTNANAVSEWPTPSFSFQMDGVPIQGIPNEWHSIKKLDTSDALRTVRTIQALSPSGTLQVEWEVIRYHDYPVMESRCVFSNPVTTNSPVLSKVLSADISISLPGDSVYLWHGMGEHPDPALNYSFSRDLLKLGEPLQISPEGGYSSYAAFPYFRLLGEHDAYAVAIGWSGEWAIGFEAQTNQVSVKAQQKNLETYLKPGERIITPRLTLLKAESERNVEQLWRGWFRAHILPRDRDGGPLSPRLVGDGDGGVGLYTDETEEALFRYWEKSQKAGYYFDAWWMDAGWYSTDDQKALGIAPEVTWYVSGGNWTPDSKRFPKGLGAFTQKLAKRGTQFVLWYEPERIHRQCKEFENLKPMLAPFRSGDVTCFELSRPEVLDYLCKQVGDSVRTNGVAIYRQDCNVWPAPFWEDTDKKQGEHRRGISENLHLQNMYRFWQYLIDETPVEWIDNCASGGRRNDLETLRHHAVPLHYSDVGYFSFIDKQRYHHVLYQWLLYFKNIIQHDYTNGTLDPYKVTIDLTPFSTVWISDTTDTGNESERKYIEIWRRAKPYLVNGDYALLSEERFAPDTWTVKQFHLQSNQSGIIQVVRNPQNTSSTFSVQMRWIQPSRVYEIKDLRGYMETKVLSGRQLLEEGLKLTLPNSGMGTILHYRTLDLKK